MRQLSKYMERIDDLEVVALCNSAHSAEKILAEKEVDVMFVDINMPDINGIDYHFSVFDKHLLWSKEARKLRMTTNAWTVNKDEDIRRVIQHKVMYITTDNPLQVRELLKEAKVREVR